MDDISKLAEMISSNEMFVKDLLADPEAALKKHNISVSAEVLKTIKGMDEAGLRELAQNYAFDKAAC